MKPRIKAALDRYMNDGILPGHFLRAVLCNNLLDACARADEDSMRDLKEIVHHCYWEFPSNIWGSPEKVMEWNKKKEQERERQNESAG